MWIEAIEQGAKQYAETVVRRILADDDLWGRVVFIALLVGGCFNESTSGAELIRTADGLLTELKKREASDEIK